MTILPIDPSELAILLRHLPAGEWPDVNDLAAQMGDSERAFKVFAAAEAEVQRDNEIDSLRAVLGQNLSKALELLQGAEAQIVRLASGQVYDVEYAESTAAADLRHLVIEATRAVRIALVLKKQIDA